MNFLAAKLPLTSFEARERFVRVFEEAERFLRFLPPPVLEAVLRPLDARLREGERVNDLNEFAIICRTAAVC